MFTALAIIGEGEGYPEKNRGMGNLRVGRGTAAEV